MPAERTRAVGCAFLRGQGFGRTVRAIDGMEAARAKIGDRWVEAALPRVGEPTADGYEGEGRVLVSHPAHAGVVDALRVCVTEARIVRGQGAGSLAARGN